jgi:CRP/FNR family transcriptional regulator, cyclic AMP receptor protein
MPFSRRGKAYLLNKIPLFSECSRAELKAVAAVTDELRLPAGRVLQGTVGRELLVLVDGEVTVARNFETIAVRGSGDFIGELALVTHRPRSATVTAVTDVRALVVTGRDFDRLVRDVPTIALKVLKTVSERLPSDEL